jgi:hypothetical protein
MMVAPQLAQAMMAISQVSAVSAPVAISTARPDL